MSKIINHLYSGTVDVTFESLKHQYFFNGKAVKSVTGILGTINKPFLINWAAKMATEKMAELFEPGKAYDEIQIKQMLDLAKRSHYDTKVNAADIGVLVHKYIERVIKGENPGELVHEEAKNAGKRFVDWINENKVEFLLSEQMVYSVKNNYCGTLDFACKIKGKLFLGDIKTSNAIYKMEMGSQMAAYRMAREEEYPAEHYEGMILVRVGKKDAEFETWEIEKPDFKKYEDIFLSALQLSNAIGVVEKEFATKP